MGSLLAAFFGVATFFGAGYLASEYKGPLHRAYNNVAGLVGYGIPAGSGHHSTATPGTTSAPGAAHPNPHAGSHAVPDPGAHGTVPSPHATSPQPVAGPTAAAGVDPEIVRQEGKLLAYYFKKGELIEKTVALNNQAVHDAIVDNGQVIFPNRVPADWAAIVTPLAQAKANLVHEGVTLALLQDPAQTPTPAQVKAFEDYLKATQKAYDFIQGLSALMLFQPGGITNVPAMPQQLRLDVAALRHSEDVGGTCQLLEQRVVANGGKFESAWGLRLRNVRAEMSQ